MADETAFKLLTNPLYFNEVMHWTDRRNLLIKVCGDVNKEDIFAAEPKLEGIRLQLESRKIEDHKKVLQAKRKEINDKIERIPIRIDEVSLSTPAIADIDFDSIKERIDTLKKDSEELRLSIGNVQSGAVIGEKKLRLSQIETEINGLRNEIAVSNNNLTVLARRELRESGEYLEALEIKLAAADSNAAYLRSLIATATQKKQAKLDEWNRENETVFVEPVLSDICYACGQKLPEGRTENQKQKALEDFNLRKSQKLESIVKEAKGTIVPMIEAYEAQLATAEKLKEELFLSIKKQLDVKEAKKQVYNEISGKAIILEADEKYIKLMNEKQTIAAELDNVRATLESETNNLKAIIGNNDRQTTALQSEYAKKAQSENANIRIESLKAEEKLLAKELMSIDKELDLVDLYITTQVGMLDSRINSRFTLARFKLFNVQVNGGIDPCCECTYKGVPYSSMNNAARINIGIDIINTLSAYYKFSAPLWIDNAESVVHYVATSSQIIKLIVSGEDKTLRIQEVS
jgi:hypothetical protein